MKSISTFSPTSDLTEVAKKRIKQQAKESVSIRYARQIQ